MQKNRLASSTERLEQWPSQNWTGWDVYWARVAGQHISMGGADSWLAHSDAIGSTTMVTDETGAWVWDQVYGPWGEIWQQTGTRPWFVFAGLRWPVNDPLYPSASREYSEGVARWMTPDPGGVKVVKLDNPQTWNMYAYVGNNPTSRNDPSGLCTVDNESHNWLWCAAHTLGFTETQKEVNARVEIGGWRIRRALCDVCVPSFATRTDVATSVM